LQLSNQSKRLIAELDGELCHWKEKNSLSQE
jgi:hypothetical protein